MKVIYSLGSTFAGPGIGRISYHTILQAQKQGMIKKILCWDYQLNEIPLEKIKNFKTVYYFLRYPLRAIQKYLFSNFDSGRYTAQIYDFLASKNIEKCDIFHSITTHCNNSLDVAKKTGAICVVSHWSSHPHTQIKLMKEESQKLGRKFFFNSEKSREQMINELTKADYVLIPSDFVYKSFIDNGFPKEKLINIPFGVDIKKFSVKKNRSDDKFRVIFVGQITIRKGIHYLLQAWKELKLKNAELVFVGNICDDAREIVNSCKADNSIKFVGFTDPREYYEKSDVFAFPSIEEGSALVSYEAMASGLPVIVSENTGSVARNEKDGFVIPIRNISILKEKINYFYKNPLKIKWMGKNARKNIEKYTWERYGDAIVKFYKKIASEKK